jgi:CheY-specific phosphatase CheX
MDFIRNVIIFGESTELNKTVSKTLEEASSKIKVILIKDRSLVSQTLSDKKVMSVFLNSKDVSVCLYLLKMLTMYKSKTNQKLSIFFTSENFDTFQEIIKKVDVENINVLPWPISDADIVEKMHDAIFDKKITKKVVDKKKNGLDIDLEFIQVFIQSTKKVLAEMGSVTDLVHEKPEFKNKMSAQLEVGIASKILISSEYFTGSFFVIFPEQSFLNLYENAVYEKCEKIDDENRDFAGELANIIYGQSKKIFSASGHHLDMAIPSIHPSSNIESELVVVIPFTSSIGKFYIAVAPGAL